MDLLPGPAEEAALDALRPFLAAHLGVENWEARLREGRPVASALVDDAAAAGVFTPTTTGTEVLVLAELGRHLAPIDLFATTLATAPSSTADGIVTAALAVPRPAATGGADHVVFGPPDAALVVVWSESGISLADAASVTITEMVECLDPTTPMAFAALESSESLPPEVTARAELLVAAMHVGLAQGARDMAVAYAKERIQFDRPIGANQAVKHLCADTATRAEAAWASLLYATASTTAGRADASFQRAVAGRVAADAARRNARANIQIHGGRGYTYDCAAHLFLTRAQVLEQISGGPRRQQRQLLAEAPLVG